MTYTVKVTFGDGLVFESTELKKHPIFRSDKIDFFMEFSNEDGTLVNLINLKQAKIITITKEEKQGNTKRLEK